MFNVSWTHECTDQFFLRKRHNTSAKSAPGLRMGCYNVQRISCHDLSGTTHPSTQQIQRYFFLHARNKSIKESNYIEKIKQPDKNLTFFWPMYPSYIPWKHQKTKCFIMFSVGIGKETLIWNGLQQTKKHSPFETRKKPLLILHTVIQNQQVNQTVHNLI